MKHKILLSLFLITSISFVTIAQEKSVSGKVVDSGDGSGIPGVSIIIKGTALGTITDIDGNYTLSAGSNSSLLFSYIGYATEEVIVGNQTVINISLVIDITTLSEVVVVGYGKQEKADVTGVIQSVSSKDFNRGAITSPEQLMVGKLAGVRITPNSGEPGGKVKIRIRGGTSITAGNEPLFVIDGIPILNDPHDPGGQSGGRNPLNFLAPEDIENITVLKDASAAAIYGSRAANGVIIITTKKGEKGESKVSYSGYFSVANNVRTVDMLDKEAYINVVTAKAPSKLEDLGSANTTWREEILQTAVGQSHNLSFSGGVGNGGYRLSLGYQDLDGIVKTSNTKRTSIAFNFNQSFLNDQLAVDVNIKASRTKDQYSAGVIGSSLEFDPTQPIYDASNTDLGGYFEYPVQNLAPNNPISALDQNQEFGEYFRNLGKVQFVYSPSQIKGLSLTTNLAYDITSGNRRRFRPSTLREVKLDSGEVRHEAMNRVNPMLNTYLKYEKEIGDSKFDVTAGYEYQEFVGDFQGYRAYRLPSDAFGFYSANIAGKIEPVSSTQENTLIAFFGRANYSYDDKYLLTASIRRDGSSKFGPNNQWGIFPSVAVGWRIINEDFMSSLESVFSDLKIRASYGVNGNQEIPNYLYLPTYTPGQSTAQYSFGNRNINTLRPNSYDENLKWEETTSYNFGLDFGVLQGRLYGSLEYYIKDTDDLLFEVAVPAGTNLSNRVTTNIGGMRNSGIELSLNAVIKDDTDLRWSIGANLARNVNEITSLDGVDDPNFEGYEFGPGLSGAVGNRIQLLKVGESINSFYVFEHKKGADGNPLPDGVDYNDDGNADDLDIYVDQNGDGIINAKDRRVYKNAAPDLIIGFSSTVNYKDFDLNFTFTSNLGGYVYNNIASSKGYYNRLVDIGANVNNMQSSVLETNYTQPQYFSDYYVEKASFVRLDNITLGYSLNKLKGLNARVYVTAQNLFVLSKYSGLDPEVDDGVDNDPYPRARTFTFGVNFGF